jgi:ATP-binding cassette subfamily C protein
MLGATGAGLCIGLGLKHLIRKTRRAGIKQTSLLKTLLGQLTDVLFSVKPIKAMAREGLVGPLLEDETRRLNLALRRGCQQIDPQGIANLLVVARRDRALFRSGSLGTRWMRSSCSPYSSPDVSCLNKIQKEYQAMVAGESAFWSLRKTISGRRVRRRSCRNSRSRLTRRSRCVR